jgi:hypothetical protein
MTASLGEQQAGLETGLTDSLPLLADAIGGLAAKLEALGQPALSTRARTVEHDVKVHHQASQERAQPHSARSIGAAALHSTSRYHDYETPQWKTTYRRFHDAAALATPRGGPLNSMDTLVEPSLARLRQEKSGGATGITEDGHGPNMRFTHQLDPARLSSFPPPSKQLRMPGLPGSHEPFPIY